MNLLMAEHTFFRSVFQVGCHHLARGFAKNNHNVTYVSAPVTPAHVGNLFGKKRRGTLIRFSNYLSGGAKEARNIYSYVPFSLVPYTNHFFLDNETVADWYLRFTLPSLVRVLDKFAPYDAALLSDPRFIPMSGRIRSRQVLLRITDNIPEFGHSPKSLARILKSRLNDFDKIIVTSNSLVPLLRDLGCRKPIFCVPNGVDFEHFASNNPREPSDLKDIPSPRVIYVGAIEAWFDTDLLSEVAAKMREVSFVIIGRPMIDTSRLSALGNVFSLGTRKYESIPRYFAHCHAGIIPFKRNSLVNCVSPLKLFEYMAGGLPVVATEWDELKLIGSPAYLASNAEEFARYLRASIDDRQGAERYRAFAYANRWDLRVRRIEEIISL